MFANCNINYFYTFSMLKLSVSLVFMISKGRKQKINYHYYVSAFDPFFPAKVYWYVWKFWKKLSFGLFVLFFIFNFVHAWNHREFDKITPWLRWISKFCWSSKKKLTKSRWPNLPSIALILPEKNINLFCSCQMVTCMRRTMMK